MGSLKFPHASGNSMSIAAPATNPASDLELKLPATIGTANQYLKNSSTAGTLEFASLGATGKVVKHAYQTYDTQGNTSSSSFTDTGLTIDFSPTAANNIVYIICMQQCYINSSGSNGDARSQFTLNAGGTGIATTQFEGSSGNSNSENAGVETLVGKFVASNTSAVTIKTQYRAVTGDAYAQHGGRESNLLIIEVEP